MVKLLMKIDLFVFISRLLRKTIPKTRGAKYAQKRGNQRSQSKPASKTTTERLLVILQRRILKLLRLRSSIIFMSGHAAARPQTATA
jgi:hypothetical protein